MILDRALQRGLVTPGEVMEGHASSCPKLECGADDAPIALFLTVPRA